MLHSILLLPVAGYIRYCTGLLLFILSVSSVVFSQDISYEALFTDASFDGRTLSISLAVGSTGGGAGVSSGAATYSIPVPVPPGTNGIAPSLSLEYNSQMPGGSLGMGWNIAGLSYITRVAQNSYFDNAVIPVSLSATDRFAIDGQRLLGKTGTYGAAESTYGTEVEDFSTVKAKGAQGGGPAWFEVITKDGIIMQYGNTADSRFMDQTSNTVISWALNRVIYPDGNYIEYVYTNADRDFRISEIRYTGNQNTSLAPYNKIEFAYKVRSDISTMYIAGSSVVSKFLLDKITVKSESGVITGSYQLTYGNDNINSYLISVQQAGSDNTKMNPSIFKYGEQPTIRESASTTIATGEDIQSFSGDFNGDGKLDIVSATVLENRDGIDYFSNFKIYLKNSSGDDFTLAHTKTLPENYTLVDKIRIPNQYGLITGDFTGDGNDDLISLNISYTGSQSKLEKVVIYESKSDGNLFDPIARTVQPNYNLIHPSKKFFYPGDFNGDGVSEYITILGNSVGNYSVFLCTDYTITGACGVITTSGTTIFTQDKWVNASRIEIIDFNGDGKHDVMLVSPSGNCEIFTFHDYTATRIYAGSFSTSLNKVYLADFNGDGKTDIIRMDSDFTTVTKSIATGTTFIESTVSLTGHLPSGTDPDFIINHLVVGDFNGDSKTDLLYGWERRKTAGSTIQLLWGEDLFYSTGDSFSRHELSFDQHTYSVFAAPLNAGYDPVFRKSTADINGDGKTDIITTYTSGSNYMSYTYFHKNGKETLLHKVSDGLNQVSEWDYKSLAEGGSFYTKGVGTPSFPMNILQPAIIAVSELKSDNGIGGQFTRQYTYEGARFHRGGKGLLGFIKTSVTDVTMGTQTLEENQYNSTYFTLVPYKLRSFLTWNMTLISETTLTNTLVSAGSKRFWVKTPTTTVYNGVAGVTTTTALEYDDYANVTKTTTSIPGVHTSETTTAYGAYPGSIPNKPTSVKVKNTRSGESAYETTTSFSYNTLGQLISRTDFSGLPQSVTTAYGYTPLGNVNSTTVSASGITTRSNSAVYDPKGRYPTESTDEMGYKSSAVYDARWAQPQSVTGTDNLTTTFEYDGFGRLKKTNFPEGFSTNQTLHWDISGNQRFYQQTATAGKPTVKTWYDLLGRETKTETEAFGSGWVTQLKTYDSKGNVATSTEPYKSGETYITTTYGYDAHNRQSSINQGHSVPLHLPIIIQVES